MMGWTEQRQVGSEWDQQREGKRERKDQIKGIENGSHTAPNSSCLNINHIHVVICVTGIFIYSDPTARKWGRNE